MISLLRRFINGSETLYECRHCGTNVEMGVERCPTCSHDGISAYRFE